MYFSMLLQANITNVLSHYSFLIELNVILQLRMICKYCGTFKVIKNGLFVNLFSIAQNAHSHSNN